MKLRKQIFYICFLNLNTANASIKERFFNLFLSSLLQISTT